MQLKFKSNAMNESTWLNSNEQLTPEEAKLLIDNYNSVVVDVRTEKEYQFYHIQGALHIPINDLSIDVLIAKLNMNNLGELQKKIVITYCNAGGRGGRAFILLKESNKHDTLLIKNLQHGINAWIQSGYPISK